jgi:hypothetical protein
MIEPDSVANLKEAIAACLRLDKRDLTTQRNARDGVGVGQSTGGP